MFHVVFYCIVSFESSLSTSCRSGIDGVMEIVVIAGSSLPQQLGGRAERRENAGFFFF
jgi:hypothetical protein